MAQGHMYESGECRFQYNVCLFGEQGRNYRVFPRIKTNDLFIFVFLTIEG